MNKVLPACYGKCSECFFYYINGCIAMSGENCFMEITRKHAALIAKNSDRFTLHKNFPEMVRRKFPEMEYSLDY